MTQDALIEDDEDDDDDEEDDDDETDDVYEEEDDNEDSVFNLEVDSAEINSGYPGDTVISNHQEFNATNKSLDGKITSKIDLIKC